MTYILSLAAGKPSFHIQTLLTQGLVLTDFVELPSVRLSWADEVLGDSPTGLAREAKLPADREALSLHQLKELCLSDE